MSSSASCPINSTDSSYSVTEYSLDLSAPVSGVSSPFSVSLDSETAVSDGSPVASPAYKPKILRVVLEFKYNK